MCGRFVFFASEEMVCSVFEVSQVHQAVEASYNVAPGQEVVTIVQKAGERHLGKLSWGLVPHWVRDVQGARRPINARSESAYEKPSFRDAFKRRRCIIPANGFYEWRKAPKGKVPMYIHIPEMPLFAMAGLWERWRSKDGESLSTCTILTTDANAHIQPIHDRMPVILAPEHWSLWLDNQHYDLQRLQSVLRPYPAEAFDSYAVSTRVNRVSNNDPSCMEPFEAPPPSGNLSLF